jgi:phosphatidylglycerophosphate synthase
MISPPKVQRLARGVLTIPNAIALSAAAMAPVLAVVLNAPAAVPAAGAALPLSFLIAFIAATLVGNTVDMAIGGQLGRLWQDHARHKAGER